jgi:uncharacterized damage-inducible protein DinB
MNHADVATLFAFDTWANDLVFDALAELDDDALRRDLKASHESVFGTLVHLVGAEEVWLARWTSGGQSKVTLPSPDSIPALDALRQRWNQIRAERDAFVDELNDDTIGDSLTMTNSRGDAYRHTYQEMFQHVVNHSSYHRGQIVTLLRQLGATPPATDLIRFHRLKS